MNCKLLSNITENLFPNGFWRQGDESIKNYEQLNDSVIVKPRKNRSYSLQEVWKTYPHCI